MRAAVLALALAAGGLAPATAGDAPPYPHRSVLSDALTNAVVRVACEPPTDTRMTCAFTEIRVEPAKAGAVPLPSKDECAGMPALRSAMVDGVPPPGTDAEAFASRFARRAEGEKADMTALFDAVEAYCADATGGAERLAAVMRDRQSRSCRLTIQTYTLDFDFAGGRWETHSAPSPDGCGAIRFGSFERPTGSPERAPWTYRVGERPGDAPGPGCPTTPATEHLYADGAPDIYAGCDYLRFTD